MASLSERQNIAKGKARQLMIILDWEVIVTAIKEELPIIFKYVDRHNVFNECRLAYPLNFWETPSTVNWAGKVWLWAAHPVHDKREQYDVSKIVDVRLIPTLLESFLDPVPNAFLLNGSISSLETTIIP